MSYLSVARFNDYQHYKGRKPPWIKLYVKLIDPHSAFNRLPPTTRYLFVALLLLAAEWDNAIPNQNELIASTLAIPTRNVREGLAELKKGGWIKETKTPRRASKLASNPASDFALPEKEIEKERTSAYARGSKPRGTDAEPVKFRNPSAECRDCGATLGEGHLENCPVLRTEVDQVTTLDELPERSAVPNALLALIGAQTSAKAEKIMEQTKRAYDGDHEA